MITNEQTEPAELADERDHLKWLLQQPERDIHAIITLAQKIGLLDTDGNIIESHCR